MKSWLAILVLCPALTAPSVVLAQQGWAPVVTPIEAKTQPLPRSRAGKPGGSEPPITTGTIAVPAPPARAEQPLLPLPFADQRKPAPEAEANQTLEPTLVRSDAPPAAAAGQGLEGPLAKAYCANIGSLAADAKFAWQKKAIGELATELEERIAKLEAKTEEYKQWLARRDEFSKRVTDNIVTIYSRMRAEAAGQQLVAMDEETAAAILLKLDPRISSAILNDMNAQHAARLTQIISGAARVPPNPAAKPAEKSKS
jgi:flagellar motility protein MotE (MotC chaperone)